MVDSGTTMLKEYEEFAAEFLAKERNLNDDLPTPPYKEEMGVQTVDTFISWLCKQLQKNPSGISLNSDELRGRIRRSGLGDAVRPLSLVLQNFLDKVQIVDDRVGMAHFKMDVINSNATLYHENFEPFSPLLIETPLVLLYYIARTLNRCIRWEADSYQMKGLMIIIERNIPDVASEILNYGWKEVLRGNKFHLAYRCNTLYLRGRFDCPARSEKERYRLDSRGDWLRLNIESDEEFVADTWPVLGPLTHFIRKEFADLPQSQRDSYIEECKPSAVRTSGYLKSHAEKFDASNEPKNRGRGRGRGKLLKPQRFLPPEIHGDLGLNCENTRTHGPVSIAHQNLHKQKVESYNVSARSTKLASSHSHARSDGYSVSDANEYSLTHANGYSVPRSDGYCVPRANEYSLRDHMRSLALNHFEDDDGDEEKIGESSSGLSRLASSLGNEAKTLEISKKQRKTTGGGFKLPYRQTSVAPSVSSQNLEPRGTSGGGRSSTLNYDN